jgi:hypothetical protein
MDKGGEFPLREAAVPLFIDPQGFSVYIFLCPGFAPIP